MTKGAFPGRGGRLISQSDRNIGATSGEGRPGDATGCQTMAGAVVTDTAANTAGSMPATAAGHDRGQVEARRIVAVCRRRAGGDWTCDAGGRRPRRDRPSVPLRGMFVGRNVGPLLRGLSRWSGRSPLIVALQLSRDFRKTGRGRHWLGAREREAVATLDVPHGHRWSRVPLPLPWTRPQGRPWSHQ